MHAKEALRIIRETGILRGATFFEALDLTPLAEGQYVRPPIKLYDCQFIDLAAPHIYFDSPIEIRGCTIDGILSFDAAYFFAGVSIQHTSVSGLADFQCGGHNRGGARFELTDSKFCGFVNFFDCCFEGPVLIKRCHFARGSNLLGNKNQPYVVTFDVAPVLQCNAGSLDLDGG
jgi:hypothetical protein